MSAIVKERIIKFEQRPLWVVFDIVAGVVALGIGYSASLLKLWTVPRSPAGHPSKAMIAGDYVPRGPAGPASSGSVLLTSLQQG